MDVMKIGAFLKELRMERNLTQEKLAAQLNVSNRTISRWETGRNMPDISMLVEIAEFYDVSILKSSMGKVMNQPMNQETKETARKWQNTVIMNKETGNTGSWDTFCLWLACSRFFRLWGFSPNESKMLGQLYTR